MYLKQLSILNYKNIEEAQLSFSPKINCFIGRNGMGKTNVLDAIYFLSLCKSHTGVFDGQAICHSADFMMIQGNCRLGEDDHEFHCGMKRGQRKVFKHDRKEYERLSEHIGALPLVMVSPSDYALITGGSDERRRFMDMILSQYDRQYLHALIAYNKALAQRNALLKPDTLPDGDLMTIWEEQMATYGSEIYKKRREMVTHLSMLFDNYYEAVGGETEHAALAYESQLEQDDFSAQLRSTRERDRQLGFSSVGVHKDDLKMTLNGYRVKRVASQGQSKSFLVSLKLAQYAFLREHHGNKPVLLLDDVFDKLDSQRVERIVQLVSGAGFGQIFMSDTNRNHINELLPAFEGSCRIFDVENGLKKSL